MFAVVTTFGSTVAARLGAAPVTPHAVSARLGALGPGLRAGDPGITPNSNGLPGLTQLQSLAGGLVNIALVAAFVGIVVSAIGWALGSHHGNARMASNGKSGILIGVAAAFVIGGADAFVTFFSHAGSTI